MYKTKPIMYSLGDFIFQNETVARLPSENYEPYDLAAGAGVADFNDRRYNNDTSGFPADREIWEAVVAMPRWEGERLRELALHPISLGFGKSRTERGRPMLADAATGKKILDDLTQRSAPFGTRITVRDGVGYVDLSQTSNHP
jgi:poly-gamma-glutamate synthesis protein (capsule biosynthesis protein)